MATIGNVTKTNDGYTGELATIRVQCPIRFVANPRKRSEGTVNLPNGGRVKTGRYPLALRGDAQFGDLAPGSHRLGTKRSIVG